MARSWQMLFFSTDELCPIPATHVLLASNRKVTGPGLMQHYLSLELANEVQLQ